MKKQFIAKLLVLALVLFMVPATILAASAATAGNNSGYYDVYEDTTVRVNEPVPETGADLTIKSSVATIIIPNEVLTNEFANFGKRKGVRAGHREQRGLLHPGQRQGAEEHQGPEGRVLIALSTVP